MRSTLPAVIRRRGGALIATVVLLAVATGLVGLWAQGTLVQRRQLQLRQFDLQAQRLAAAGAARATAQLAAGADYQGETWEVSADQFGGRHAGVVHIEVSTGGTIRATADYPARATHRARRTAHAAAVAPTQLEPETIETENGEQQ